jgi:small-conductance mechanosensitive channel
MRKIMASGIRAMLILFGLLFALSAVGVDLTALSVLGGALGVGLGLGLQKLAANYVSGFVILFERSVRIGDSVKIDGFEGRVSDIKTRYTLIRALNGREAIIPNEKLITERVENLSLADPKVLVSSVLIVGYDSDVMQVQTILCKAALGHTRVLADPEPVAHLTQFAPDGLEFTLLFWINDPDNGQMNVKSHINVEILHALRAAGIKLPYPQRVVHMQESSKVT